MKEKDSVIAIIFFLLLAELYFNKPLLIWISVGIALISIMSVSFTHFLHVIWFQFTGLLGKINSNIILIIFFFLILCPLAFIRNIFSSRKNLLDIKRSNSAFVIKNKLYEKGDFENLW